MSFLKFKIRFKLAVVLMSIVLFVIGLSTLVWYGMVRSILQTQIIESQHQVSTYASDKVSEFINAKVRNLIIHSQSAAFLTENTDAQKIDLTIFLSQDRDILSLAAMDKTGMETIKTSKERGFEANLLDRSKSPSFIANTFRYSKEYVGDVEFSEEGSPSILISVPIKTPTGIQNLSELSTESQVAVPGSSDLVLGVLEARIDLKSIFAEITDLKIREENAVFIVDKNGRIIASRAKEEVIAQSASSAPPVALHLETIEKDPIAHSEAFQIFEYDDIHGVPVLGSHSDVRDTSWAIVVEQPVSLAYGNLDQLLRFSLIVLFVSIGLTIPTAYFLAQRITNPVLAITTGANQVSQGHLEARIKVRTDDELEDMASAFNNMTQKLQKSIEELKNDKDIINSERDKLEVVLSGIEDAVVALDVERNVVLLNSSAEKLTGYQNKDVIGNPISKVFKLFEGEEEVVDSMYCVAPNAEGRLYEKSNITLRSSNGVEKTIHLVTGEIESEESEVRYILTIQDLSAKQRLEEMKVDFVSMAAHELRTPLTSMRGYLAVFMDEYGKDLNKDQKMLITSANEASRRLTELVESLLSLTKIEQSGIPINKKKLPYLPLVQKFVNDFIESGKEQNVELQFVFPKTEIPEIEFDELRIGEVLSNLITNAIKYTNPGGKVTVSIEYNQKVNAIITSVKDSGIGIPGDALPHLFTKFYRVPGKLEQTARGTGLGLYISKKIIDLHNGDIWVQSKEGIGSVFAFSLPMKTEAKKRLTDDRH